MSDIWALVPVKSPQRAKTRLAPVLEPGECALLSQAMLLDVLAALGAAETVNRVAVLTSDDEVAELVKKLGHTVITDNAAFDLSTSLNSAAQELSARGATTILIMPGDMPTVRPDDIDNLLARHAGGLSLCPAIRDGGTNVLIASPPNAINFCFGADSAQKHLDAATSLGLQSARLPVQAFFRDIDVPDDLAWLVQQECESHSLRFLRDSGISARLGSQLSGQPL